MAESAAKPAAAALPSDAELLGHLERAVDEVFTTMIGACQRRARVDGVELIERPSGAELELLLDGGALLRVDREAVVEFRGALDGRVAIRANAACAKAIARGLLMSEEDDALALEEVNDALKECANMLTGWLKSKALDPLGAFSMSVPFIKNAPRELVGKPAGTLVYSTSGGEFAIELWRRVPLPAPLVESR